MTAGYHSARCNLTRGASTPHSKVVANTKSARRIQTQCGGHQAPHSNLVTGTQAARHTQCHVGGIGSSQQFRGGHASKMLATSISRGRHGLLTTISFRARTQAARHKKIHVERIVSLQQFRPGPVTNGGQRALHCLISRVHALVASWSWSHFYQ